jgi:hypothetical protein
MRRQYVPGLVLVGIVSVLASREARAGVRIWENNPSTSDAYQYVDIGGFIQPGLIWRQNDPLTHSLDQYTDSGAWLQRARLNFALQVTKYFTVRMEFELAGGTPAVQDAYAESAIFHWLNIRAGQFLVPFLQTYQFNEASIAFLDRQLYVPQNQSRSFLQYLQPRDIGFSISGLIGDVNPKASLPVLEYAVGIFNGQGANVTNNPDEAFEYTGRLQLHILGVPEGRKWESDLARNPRPKVAVGVGGFSNCDGFQNWDRGFTADTEVRYQGLYASASFVWFHNGGAAAGNPLNYHFFCSGGQVPENIANGAHVQAQYLLPSAWLGPTGGSLEILARFDYVTPFAAPSGFLGNTTPGAKGVIISPYFDDANTAPQRWRITAGVNWFPIRLQSLRLSVNYQFTQQTEPFTVGDNLITLSPSSIWAQLTAGI